jgi:exopolysaccharide biosynthesis predicted pyruvyltransferase EpsI
VKGTAGVIRSLNHEIDRVLALRESHAFAGREFGVRSMPCPDMALGLGDLPRPSEPAVPVLWQSRDDKEARNWGIASV